MKIDSAILKELKIDAAQGQVAESWKVRGGLADILDAEGLTSTTEEKCLGRKQQEKDRMAVITQTRTSSLMNPNIIITWLQQ